MIPSGSRNPWKLILFILIVIYYVQEHQQSLHESLCLFAYGSSATISSESVIEITEEDPMDSIQNFSDVNAALEDSFFTIQNNYSKCSCQKQNKNGTGGGRIAYAILLHNERTLKNALPLFMSIAAPGNIVLIHIDTKLSFEIFKKSEMHSALKECPCGANILIGSEFSCNWAAWNMNEPTLWAMETLISNKRFINKWDVFINLSADTLPVYTPSVISKLFAPKDGPLYGTNFVTSSSTLTGLLPTNILLFPKSWHKREHYTTNPSGDYFEITYTEEGDSDTEGSTKTKRIEIHFGSQWVILEPKFVNYLVTSLRRKNSLPSMFKKELITRRKGITDEVFIPTLLVHLEEFQHTLPVLTDDGYLQKMPQIRDIRYERMDEHSPTAFGDVMSKKQRYEVHKESGVENSKPWGPYYLGVYDLADIALSGALFIRKVSADIDKNLMNIFPVEDVDQIPFIEWPNHVKVSDRPSWYIHTDDKTYEQQFYKEYLLFINDAKNLRSLASLSGLKFVDDDDDF